MENDIKKSVAEYLTSHRYLALATTDPDGRPVVHNMGYANEGATIYLATFKGTRKVGNIERNPNVALAVSEDYDDWGKIQGVQIQGKASFLETKEDIDRAVSCIVRNFPHFANMDPNPDIIFLKIEPVEGFFIDYTKGFAHKDKVMY